MSDLISKRAVLDELEKWDWQDLYLPIHFKQILDDVPSVENKGDLISRQAVLDGIAEWIVNGYADSDADCSHISSLVTHLPSVENKGEWILLDECSNSGYYCSKCHKKVVKEGWSETVKKIKFCPNCGSDMRGE